MSARINYGDKNRGCGAMPGSCPEPTAPALSDETAILPDSDPDEVCCGECGEARGRYSRHVNFCETITLHESFDASGISSCNTTIAYDTSFLGYAMEEVTMDARLPCGVSCPVNVFRITLTGAIPYIINVGTVHSSCGSSVHLSVQGSTMVDEVIGYVCGCTEPDLKDITCENVTPTIRVSTEQCGCSDKTNVTVYGKFVFTDLTNVISG